MKFVSFSRCSSVRISLLIIVWFKKHFPSVDITVDMYLSYILSECREIIFNILSQNGRRQKSSNIALHGPGSGKKSIQIHKILRTDCMRKGMLCSSMVCVFKPSSKISSHWYLSLLSLSLARSYYSPLTLRFLSFVVRLSVSWRSCYLLSNRKYKFELHLCLIGSTIVVIFSLCHAIWSVIKKCLIITDPIVNDIVFIISCWIHWSISRLVRLVII